jgi:hypothetical protein
LARLGVKKNPADDPPRIRRFVQQAVADEKPLIVFGKSVNDQFSGLNSSVEMRKRRNLS